MYQNEVKPYLDEYFKRQKNNKVRKIIEYSVRGGKYIRGFIVKHIIEILTEKEASQWEPIVCVELIHAASLVIDGKIISAVQEERFTRIMNDKTFPINSI